MRRGGLTLLPLLLSIHAEAQGMTLQAWASKVLGEALPSPAIQESVEVAQGFRISANSALLPPSWNFDASTTFGLPVLGNGNTTLGLQAQASKYLGKGVDFVGTTTVSTSGFTPPSGITPLAAIGGSLEFDVDLWKNKGGRYELFKRNATASGDLSQRYDSLAQRETFADELLEGALDVCSQISRVGIGESLIKQAEELFDELKSQGRVGLVGSSDLVQFEDLILKLQKSQVELQQGLAFAQQNINARFEMQLKPAECPVLDIAAITAPPARSATEIAALFTSSPGYSSTIEKLRQSEIEKRIAEWDLVPVLQPFGGVSGAFASGNLNVNLGVKFQWNFGGPRESVAYLAAVQRSIAARVNQKLVLDSLLSKYMSAIGRQRQAIQLYQMTKKQVDLTGQFLEIEESRYQIGKSTILNLTTAYQDRFSAVSSLPDLASQAIKSEWQILSLRGQLIASLGSPAGLGSPPSQPQGGSR